MDCKTGMGKFWSAVLLRVGQENQQQEDTIQEVIYHLFLYETIPVTVLIYTRFWDKINKKTLKQWKHYIAQSLFMSSEILVLIMPDIVYKCSGDDKHVMYTWWCICVETTNIGTFGL